MFLKNLSLSIILTLAGAGLSPLWAEPNKDQTASEDVDVMALQGGFAKPYEYERQAYGYDPEGIQYKENQSEDFQVVFITSAPFTAGASFLLTSLVSLATRNTFDVSGDYFWPFIGGTFVGCTTIACVSTLTNKYPPPPASAEYSLAPLPKPNQAFQLPLVTARF